MIKVLHIINSLEIGGAEKLVAELLPLINTEEIHCDLLLLNGKDSFLLKELAKRQDIRIISLGNRNIYNPFIIFRIYKYLKAYNLIHAHLFPSLYWSALAKFIFSLDPILLTTEHSPDNPRRRWLILKWIDRRIYRFYNTIIAVSVDGAAKLISHLKTHSPVIEMVHNGINIESIIGTPPVNRADLFDGCSENMILVLKVARFSSAKDHKTLIRSLCHLPDTVHILLAGEGDLQQDCRELADGLGLNQRVHFLGLRADVAGILKSVDINVMSSFYEGISLSALEAMASGNPFLASNVSGLNELTENAGILFEQGNPRDLAEKILMLMNDKELSAKVAADCLKRAQEYSISRTAEKYLKIYKSVIGNRN